MTKKLLNYILSNSLDRMPISSTSISTTAIPRPTAKRQLSQPTTSTSTPINLSANLFNITKLPRMCTNPFLNGTLDVNRGRSEDITGETIKTSSVGSLEVTNEEILETSSTEVDMLDTKPCKIIESEKIRQSSSSSCNLNNPFIMNNNNEETKIKDQKNFDGISRLEGKDDCGTSSYDLMNECEKKNRKKSFDNDISKDFYSTADYKIQRKKSRKSAGEIFIDLNSPPIPNIGSTSIQELPSVQPTHILNSQSTSSDKSSGASSVIANLQQIDSIFPQSNIQQQELDDVFLDSTNPNPLHHQSSARFYNILSKLNDDTFAASSSRLSIQGGVSNDNINIQQQQSRTRSLSETEFLDSHRINADFCGLQSSSSANPFVNTKLHKTLSENFLEQYNTLKNSMKTGSGGLSFNVGSKTSQLSRDGSIKSLGSNCSMESIDENVIQSQQVQRALSCESVTSQSSIIASDLMIPTPTITGYLCIGLQYDKYDKSINAFV